jgi:hypothetical protein
MSRATDLYWQAASKAAPSVSRLYFDTEPLRCGNWPFLSEQLHFSLRLAMAMRVELYIPEPVLHERTEQWIREALEELSAASAKAVAAHKTVRRIGLASEFKGPSEGDLRTRYAKAEEIVLAKFGMLDTPYPSLPLEEVFRMAVARNFTFEDKKVGVVGLQDCVILLSVFDHLRSNPAPSAFVSSDGVFSRIQSLSPGGVDLRLIPGVTALQKFLEDAHDLAFGTEIKRWWTEETERIMAVLTMNRERVQEFLDKTIDRSETDRLFDGKVVALERPEIESFGSMRPGLEGAQDEPIRFSCDVKVSYTAVVEQRPFSLSLALLGRPEPPREQPEPVQTTQRRNVTVELAAQVTPDYSVLTLESARINA